MEVTSRMPGLVCGPGGRKARASDVSISAIRPVTASHAGLRTNIMTRANTRTVTAIMAIDGVATRKSARRKPPKPCTVPVIACSAKALSSAGSFARTGDTYPTATVKTAAGIRSWVSGTTATLAGSPIVVAR